MKKLLLATALLLGSATASAELVVTDGPNKTWGERTVLDTDTSLTWAAFYGTRNATINSMLPKTASGEQYDGFRLATTSEVTDLIDNIFGFDFAIGQTLQVENMDLYNRINSTVGFLQAAAMFTFAP